MIARLWMVSVDPGRLEGYRAFTRERLLPAYHGQSGLVAVLLVEQHVEAALRLSENAVVLERGRVVHAGPSRVLAQDQALLESLVALPSD